MDWKFNNDKPIYSQIIEQINNAIASGRIKPGDKLQSVRELAQEAGVNPNTMQKALSELEQKGILYSNRTSGRYVSDNVELIAKTKEALAEEKTIGFISQMKELGFTNDGIINIIKKIGG